MIIIRTIIWYSIGWAYLVLTYPVLLRVKYLNIRNNNEKRDKLAFRSTTILAKLLFYVTGSKIKIIGLDNIPADEAVLFVSNHQGHMDSVIIHAFINKPKGFISIVEAFKFPILSTWMKYMKCVFIDRNDARQSLECINQGIDNLKNNHSMVVFPEGKLSNSKTVGEFNRGWLKLATKSGVPIVPITIKNSYKILSNNGSKVSAGLVECIISKPIYINSLKKRDEIEFINNLRAIIQKNL